MPNSRCRRNSSARPVLSRLATPVTLVAPVTPECGGRWTFWSLVTGWVIRGVVAGAASA
jgi:hypothetical protein